MIKLFVRLCEYKSSVELQAEAAVKETVVGSFALKYKVGVFVLKFMVDYGIIISAKKRIFIPLCRGERRSFNEETLKFVSDNVKNRAVYFWRRLCDDSPS